MPVNRKQAPQIHSIEQLNLPKPSIHYLDNGVPVYEICMGTQEILKLELVFAAGRTVAVASCINQARNLILVVAVLQCLKDLTLFDAAIVRQQAEDRIDQRGFATSRLADNPDD